MNNRRTDQINVVDTRKVNEEGAIIEVFPEVHRTGQGQPSLANTARPSNGHQARCVVPDERTDIVNFTCSADEWCQRDREPVQRSLGGALRTLPGAASLMAAHGLKTMHGGQGDPVRTALLASHQLSAADGPAHRLLADSKVGRSLAR
jgi:hypothetical protein